METITTMNPQESQWYIMKGQEKYGPFNYVELIQMRQEKKLFEFDYIWAPGLKGWTTLSEVPLFKAPVVQQFIQSNEQLYQNNICRRRNKRIEKRLRVFVHNKNQVWRGSTVTLSVGGASLVMENSLLIPGDHITLHFTCLESPEKSFNVDAEIIGKKFSPEVVRANTLVNYCVRFFEVPTKGLDVLKMWVGE